jgi:hypothetical protein
MTAVTRRRLHGDPVDVTPRRDGGDGGGDRPRVGTCELLPFPLVRRIDLIRNVAGTAVCYRDPSKFLATQIAAQERALRRRGFPDDVVSSQIAALRRAIAVHMAMYEAAR